MLTLSVLPDGRLEVRHHGLILHTLTAPEAFVLAGNILAPHHYAAVMAVHGGEASGAGVLPAPVPDQARPHVQRNNHPDAPAGGVVLDADGNPTHN